ncbi:MAG: hypothetical protein GY708_25295 [Actinomycetia bacterium]|nr:hypothetical protein [Actinomycetes bacterium]
MSSEIDLDHVAIASESGWDNVDRYAGDLGGRWAGGGLSLGFHFCQITFANDVRIEILEPRDVHEFDFLRRFLDRNGPGPHHITFKVPLLDDAIARAIEDGYRVVGVNREDDNWQEAFIHPKSSHGIVVQMAQQGGNGEGESVFSEAEAHPEGRSGKTASLERLVHLVADLNSAEAMFADVLGGTVVGEGSEQLGPYRDLTWPGPARLRLVNPTEPAAAAWMGPRAGRLHHFRFSGTEGVDVTGAVGRNDGTREVRPENNLGVRLVLAP